MLRATTVLMLGAAWLAACEIEQVNIPPTDKQVAIHAVLSATAQTQVVLVERTRNGTVHMSAPSFELEDAIGSDAGIAETDALVSLTTPAGQTLFALEDKTTNIYGAGQGVYRFELPGSALQRGATYRLSVRTKGGERLFAETAMPGGVAADVAESRSFDRTRDTMIVSWPATAGARSFFVRIETPFGPRYFFTDSTSVRLTGDLRNIQLDALPRVFIPGFPQAITVSAVDSNYYDWYRTRNDALSGAGLVNRVTGGLGVFGSLVRLRFRNADVVAPQTDAPAGTYKLVGSLAELSSAANLGFELYVESRAARNDQPDALSGRYTKRTTLGHPGCPVCGLLGTVKDGHVELAFLNDWSARDTADVLLGEIHGDTIVGGYRIGGGISRFVRQH
jgi:hypothetical protein